MTIEAIQELPPDPILERRELVQRTAAHTLARRTRTSKVMVALCGLALVLALVPLVAVIIALLQKGLSWWSVNFFTQVPAIPSITDPNNVGGVANAIVGSVVIVSVASLFAIPIGVIAGILLADSTSKFADIMRAVAEIMTGLPSILLGIFAYEMIVVGFDNYGIHLPGIGFSGIAGSFALAVLMVPIIMKAAETALRGVPGTVKEAGLALGARKSVVARKVVIPGALPGLLTAVLLAFARAVGETAPLLWVIGASSIITWNPRHEMAAMPLQIFQWALNSPYPSQREAAWGLALFLVVAVLIINLAARLIAARLQKERR
jgi:phosphate transport system permease protein